MYWTDSGRDVIEVAQMKGENRKTLISGMIDEPHAIVVDPLRGCVGVLWGGIWAEARKPLGWRWVPSPQHGCFLPDQPEVSVLCRPLGLPGCVQPWPSLMSPGVTLACPAGAWLLLGWLSWAARFWASPPLQGAALPTELGPEQHIAVLEIFNLVRRLTPLDSLWRRDRTPSSLCTRQSLCSPSVTSSGNPHPAHTHFLSFPSTMYWSDWGNHPKIETAAMDGTLRETLVQDNIQWPTGPCYRGGDRGEVGLLSSGPHKSWGGKGA